MSQPDRLARSERELEAANLVLDHGYNEQACGHAYYAAFYAVQEAVSQAGRSAKTHSGTLRVFGELLNQQGLPTDASALFARLQRRRDQTTYRWIAATVDEGRDAIFAAEQVIAAARELITKLVQE